MNVNGAVGVTQADATPARRTRSYVSVTTIMSRVNIGPPTWLRPRAGVCVVRTADGIAGIEVRAGWLRVAGQVAFAWKGTRSS